MLLFYVFISYGAKPSGDLRGHPEARPQFEALERLGQNSEGVDAKVFYDYCRSVRRLQDLEKLVGILNGVSHSPRGAVCIDDIGRIFRRTPLAYRETLFAELSNEGRRIFSLRHNMRLEDFSHGQRDLLILHPEKTKKVAISKQPRNTSRARIASVESRRAKSENANEMILRLRNELLASNGDVNFQMVADCANKRGLRTAMGKTWSRKSVSRVLKAGTTE
jgi:hypothetical protein